MNKIFPVLCLGLLVVSTAMGQKEAGATHLEPTRKVLLRIPEPSDITMVPDGSGYYIVSDQGELFQTDLDGKIVKQAKHGGVDYEGVWADDKTVYVMSESLRRIMHYEPGTLKLIDYTQLTYLAGRNEGFESIAIADGRMIYFSEKNPCEMHQMNLTNGMEKVSKIKGIHEVSSCTFQKVDGKNQLWVLSDEERSVYKMKENENGSWEVESRYIIPVYNPEGICFNKEGQMLIVSDDMQTLYFFNKF